MILTGVKLKNYRSYADQVFEFEPGVNIVVGPNASGKTNLLEAVYVAAKGRSFRNSDKELIAYNKPWARVDMLSNENHRTVKVWRDGDKTKEFDIGPNKKRRLTEADKLPLVLFTPEHLRSLSGAPTNRRKLIDELVAAMQPDGQTVINRFQRALNQRNHLLKQPNPDKDELFVWAVRLGELGGQLAAYRQAAIAKLNSSASKIYSELAGKKHEIGFIYKSELGDGETYRRKLDKHLQSQRDRDLGFTSQGPHRDDIAVEINGHNSQTAASRGELRTLVLVAKIAELDIIEGRTGERPWLLLDDVFSELDGLRRRQLSSRLSEYQTIITTTDADAVVEYFAENQQNILAL